MKQGASRPTGTPAISNRSWGVMADGGETYPSWCPRGAGAFDGRNQAKSDSFPVMDKDASVFVAGHGGLVGAAVVRRLAAGGYRDVVTAGRAELDLRDQAAVR